MSYEIPNVGAITLDKLDSIEKMLSQFIQSKTDRNGMDEESFFTVKKTAEFLDVSEPYVYTLKKKLPHIIRGGRLYFKKSDLVEYLEKGRVIPDPSKRRSRH
ncbi:helix-turn-helix domain-containing protein [Dyadobacter sp. CY345]|uniref:helix-turn-helix domain-containing protein n=1 Tax=Dyadobacter sp. CY345 TaxID=2909335 RepID=UPI001F169EB2|nr:helix-turn-helix domain-containing protein [Dyadobacter sp. CY345]MCF2443633.1 helix-turn-helix domain-containing protein [Dyadobacter sp. CY345]